MEIRNDYVGALYSSYTALAGNSYFGAVPDMLCRPAQPSTAEASAWSNTNLDMLGIAASISASNEFFMNR